MEDKDTEMLRQIAIDVAVIKSEIQNFKEVKSELKETQHEVARIDDEVNELKTQMRLVKWVSSSSFVALIGYIVVKLAKLVI